jgi:hypothetical protein
MVMLLALPRRRRAHHKSVAGKETDVPGGAQHNNNMTWKERIVPHRSMRLSPARGPHRVLAAVRRVLQAGAGVVATSATGMIPAASADTFPALFPLQRLYTGDGSEGVVLRGLFANQFSRGSVSTAGDVNGDGVDDLILGGRRGESYVVSGSASGFPPVFSLASLSPPDGDGSMGFVLEQDERSGAAVSDAGDVNGDGVDDVIVGSLGYQRTSGIVYVLFGRAGGSFPAVVSLEGLLPGQGGDGSAGFALRGYPCGYAGASVSTAGDVNGDGVDDLIVARHSTPAATTATSAGAGVMRTSSSGATRSTTGASRLRST